MELYKKLTVTASAGLLDDARFAINNIRKQLRTLSFDEEVDPSKMPKAIKDAADALTKSTRAYKSSTSG